MAVVTMQELLQAGIHFGHQTRRWNPRMAKYIFGQRNGIYIIDLQKTLRQVHAAYKIVRDTAAGGGTVLFIGTKKQAREPIAREATRANMYYINNRWLGGTLTNFATVKHSVRNLGRLQELESSGKINNLSKKEASQLRRKRLKLEKNLSGIQEMDVLPSVVFVIDAKREAIAIREAERCGIPCIAVVDTNANPEEVPIPIPGNDDAIRAVNLFCKLMADAALEGQGIAEKSQAEERARKGVATPAEDNGEEKPAEAPAAAEEAAPAEVAAVAEESGETE
jgi:small subunit ribosomal protein S2